MSPAVCRACASRLPSDHAGVDIFSQNTFSGLRKERNDVKTAIELITGVVVSPTDGLPGRICAECNDKLEGFLAFREQLLTSLRVFRSPGYNCIKSEQALEVISSSPELEIHNEDSDLELRTSDQGNERTDESRISVTGSSRSKVSNGSEKIIPLEEDVESDIDVCSGEDDGVLELDVQSRKDEIYEIESSGESDIQVCDFEPDGL